MKVSLLVPTCVVWPMPLSQARFQAGEGYSLGTSGQAIAKMQIRTTIAMLTAASTFEAARAPRELASDPPLMTRVDHTSTAIQMAKPTTANPTPISLSPSSQ